MTSLPHLVHIGVQTMLLAFKTGTYVDSMGQRMSPSDRTGSWSRIAVGWTEEEAIAKLDAFHAETVSNSTASEALDLE
jgi:hypothetical protein